MPLASISRLALEILNQNYRAPAILPGPVPPARGSAAAPSDPNFNVADEFIRIVPFINADINGRPMARQYQVRSAGDLPEAAFTARGAGTPWTPGNIAAFGQDLDLMGASFKRVGFMVRVDELMQTGATQDMLNVQRHFARIATVRGLSEAIFASNPASDDNAELAGLPFFLPANSPQDVAYDPGAKMMGGLAELEARCSPSDGDFGSGPDVFVTSSRARWRLLAEMEARGVTPNYAYCPLTGRMQLHYHGVPVLTGRVPEPASGGAAADATTEAWALKLFGPSGVCVLHVGGDPADYGLREEPITTVTALDATGEARNATSGVEIFGVYSLRVPEIGSIARLHSIPALDPIRRP